LNLYVLEIQEHGNRSRKY